ncbi:DNA-binding transcriptional LysR family regulator [Pseudochelatococcus lubricantis]|uniref:DNA-binding transcriptional LysR family regulator n=1 Tax=Pseudochelatococcus lubricantis TaxID=1538102 RepID=A0ABX0V1W3_9HYPH|nr:LysR substrate-binding domain-containing protein [Pseudochelatococcus lubricantis]NIJ59122.1 DNA-binding transcriptional LysR family regulator [Pseudochelatococcus lubricantis]
MTFEQLTIFVAVAEREHLTRAASALGLTPSAVSASIKTLESFYNVRLFERVGRGIELTRDGQTFLKEAKETLARVRAAELVLGDLGNLKRGHIDIHASQTIANYWLPQRLLRFRDVYPEIELSLTVGNTMTVTRAVVEGTAELGFIEGTIDEPAIAAQTIALDQLVVVVPSGCKLAPAGKLPVVDTIRELAWIMREPGSGTRSEFEAALQAFCIDVSELKVLLTLPSNEAVLKGILSSGAAAALSRAVVEPFIGNGTVTVLDIPLPSRKFTILKHKERRLSSAARRLSELFRNSSFGT